MDARCCLVCHPCVLLTWHSCYLSYLRHQIRKKQSDEDEHNLLAMKWKIDASVRWLQFSFQIEVTFFFVHAASISGGAPLPMPRVCWKARGQSWWRKEGATPSKAFALFRPNEISSEFHSKKPWINKGTTHSWWHIPACSSSSSIMLAQNHKGVFQSLNKSKTFAPPASSCHQHKLEAETVSLKIPSRGWKWKP